MVIKVPSNLCNSINQTFLKEGVGKKKASES